LKSQENPFKLEKREFPVDFGYPSKSTYRIIVNLPERFKIESMPESSAVALPDNMGVFKFSILGSGSKIQLIMDYEINVSYFYVALNDSFFNIKSNIKFS
jgi:hypothetical protein